MSLARPILDWPLLRFVQKIDPEDHIGLAKDVVQEFVSFGFEDSDEYGDALLGLCEAAKTFKPELGYKFSTWAKPVIRNQILMGLRWRERRTKHEEEMVDTPGEESVSFCLDKVKEVLDPTPDDTEEDRIDKEIIRQHYLEEKTLAIIAKKLSLSTMGVLYRERRGLAKIRANLDIDSLALTPDL